jgi:hypothetical protein
MYFAVVGLLTFLLPIGSVLVDHFVVDTAPPLLALVGKWFVFWSAGIRLILAGLRQFYQPQFTAKEIFDLKSDDALPIVQELGIANFATGVVGVVALAMPSFVLPVAISSAIFYGVAGIRHSVAVERTLNETVAMVSDLFVCLALVAYLAFSIFA